MNKYLKIARFDHWFKNIFMLPGIAAAYLLADRTLSASVAVRILTGFLATGFIASANYVTNEWLDREFDQYHPVKKYRPVVTENMKGSLVALEYICLAVLGIGLSLTVNSAFLIVEIWLLVMGLLYNVKPFRTKDVPYLDVLSESVNNVIRLMLGWTLITTAFLPPASLALGYWMAGAYLMAVKRFAEYRMIGDPVLAGQYRKSFRRYTQKTLMGSSFFYAMSATFCLGIFMIKYRVEYIVAVPVMFLLFAYYLMLSLNEDSAVQKPEKLYREKKLMGIVLVFLLILVIMTFWDVPFLESFHDPYLLEL